MNESVVAPTLTQLKGGGGGDREVIAVASRKLSHGQHKVRLARGHPAPEEGSS